MLQIQNLTSGYGKMPALHNLSIEVRPNEAVALIGPNGAGKSTVLKSIFNLVDIHQGQILWNARPITRAPTHTLLRRGIAFVPQGRLVFSALTVEENLRMGAYVIKEKETIQKNLEAVYGQFSILKEKQNTLAANLSGGQQQLLAIARAMMTTPKLLLLDEPSLGLSPQMMKEVFAHLRTLRAQGIGLLIVEQNVHLALDIATRVYLLSGGRVRHEGLPEDFKNIEKMRKMFLGS